MAGVSQGQASGAFDWLADLGDFAPRWLDGWNRHDLDALEALVTEDITWEDPAMHGKTVHGRAEFRAFSELFFRAFPDVRIEPAGVPYVRLEGRGIAVRARMLGTFSGELVRWGEDEAEPVPGTGRSFDVPCVDLYDFRDSRIAHWILVYDLAGFAEQIGVEP